MYYLSERTVSNAYSSILSTKTPNKFWGLLSVIHEIDSYPIKVNHTYILSTKKISLWLDEILYFGNENKDYGERDCFVRFPNEWIENIADPSNGILKCDRINILDVACFIYKLTPFEKEYSASELIAKLRKEFNLSEDMVSSWFDNSPHELSYKENTISKSSVLAALKEVKSDLTDCISFEVPIKARPGEMTRAPFIQTLYAGTNALKCLMFATFNLEELYPTSRIEKIETKEMTLQQVYYGAPGTGKSHEIKEKTKGKSVIRTTFHPDSDYSTFVGAYKPIMGKGNVYGAQGPLMAKNGQPIEEPKIKYEFVKQAFLKAYLGAWKKIGDGINSYPKVSFEEGGAKYDILSVNDIQLTQKKTDKMAKGKVGNVWKSLWKNGKFEIPQGTQSGQSVEQAIAKWIYDNYTQKENDFENGWGEFISELHSNEKIKTSKTDRGKIYQLLYDNQNTVIFCAESNNKKEIIEKCYNSESFSDNFERGITKKLKSYGAGSFDNAWKMLKNEVNAIDSQFLIIEEINRGNCAQIFGDLFQLLDRSGNGYSEYPIEADTDMQAAIKNAFAEEDEYKLNSLNIDGVIDDYVSNYNHDSTLSEDVKEGRVLLLPPNLYIWATMNTSDQSLFPIDSAFKRRWDWKYMPIGYKNSNWTIEIGDKRYKWVDFQKIINQKIYDVDNSEDKQLGDYFVNADRTGGKISAETLLNKILFYIWNDVCKDDPDQIFRWINDKQQEEGIKFSDFFGEDIDTKLQGFMKFHKVPAFGETANTDNTEDIQNSEETETNESPTEDGNDVNE